MMTKPWAEIRSYYEKLPHGEAYFDSMRNLVEEIVKSRYVVGIYAWTSMHDLCVVQTEVTYPYNGPYLRISPLRDGKVKFLYIDTYIKDKQWHRTVEGKDSFARLEKFFHQLHWFSPMQEINKDGSPSNEDGPSRKPGGV
jgi:hypothetical protein